VPPPAGRKKTSPEVKLRTQRKYRFDCAGQIRRTVTVKGERKNNGTKAVGEEFGENKGEKDEKKSLKNQFNRLIYREIKK
jgi:hypothetical protein